MGSKLCYGGKHITFNAEKIVPKCSLYQLHYHNRYRHKDLLTTTTLIQRSTMMTTGKVFRSNKSMRKIRMEEARNIAIPKVEKMLPMMIQKKIQTLKIQMKLKFQVEGKIWILCLK